MKWIGNVFDNIFLKRYNINEECTLFRNIGIYIEDVKFFMMLRSIV